MLSHDCQVITVNPLCTDTRYNDKICYNDNLNVMKPSVKKWQFLRIHAIIKNKTSSNIFLDYLLDWPHWGNSNKYPKHMFYEEIRIKQGLSYITFCPLRILYNCKLILMAISLGTNVVVEMRVHCISIYHTHSNLMTPSEKVLLNMQKCADSGNPAYAKYHPGLCSPFIHSVVSNAGLGKTGILSVPDRNSEIGTDLK